VVRIDSPPFHTGHLPEHFGTDWVGNPALYCYSNATCSTLLRLVLLQQDTPKPCRVLLQATTKSQCGRCRRHVRRIPAYALVRSGRRLPPVEACVRLFATQVYSSLRSHTGV